MNDDERNDFNESVRMTTELFKNNRTTEDWADNLIKGSRSLKTGNSWKHYYAWLANPTKYNEEEVNKLATCGEEPQAVIEDYPDCMKVETFQNGIETIIHVRNMSLEEKDEKTEE